MLSELLRNDARGCRTNSPINHLLLQAAADDLESGGITTRVLAGCERDPQGSVPGLRLAGALHKLVLDGKAPELARHYPSVGGHPSLNSLWDDAEHALRAHAGELRARMRASSMQTDEPGRNGPLFGGLLVAAERAAVAAGRRTPFPIRLLEVGASAGLNLRPHRIAYRLPDGSLVGDLSSKMVLPTEWAGLPEADLSRPLAVIDRAGCDLHPVDVTTAEGRNHLSSFVNPDESARMQRLQDAMDLAGADPVTVDPATGPEWLADRLAEAADGVLTVLWHSVVWQYLPIRDRASGRSLLADAAASATSLRPLGLLVYEARRVPRSAGGPYRFDLLLRLWPSGISLHLGSGDATGIPFTWAEQHWT
ncbi:DUF2332 domain-containing protein [Pseudonocardiaceae bacterium YIM PH 21723]|nr:DUF2332 domain-containing protein [Pseudonocardiaceae bacterium YIM PH 21723]